jgi:hypothetical protein
MLKSALTLLLAAVPAAAQMGMGMGMRTPDIPGVFHPVNGSGAVYHISTARQPNLNVAIAIVGQEGDAYWMEIRMSGTQNGDIVMKQLMSPGGNGRQPQITRRIVQTGGSPPMELPAGMGNMSMGRGAPGAASATHEMGAKLGTESITVPAGTFECDHYVSTSASGKKADLWISTRISPYGLVKMTSEDTNMELQKVLEHEATQIKGEPMKLNIPNMPNR